MKQLRGILPKAELHVHLEGTARPSLVRRLAAAHGVTLDPQLFDADGQFKWFGFLDFLKAYDAAALAIRTAEDYRTVTADYLADCAAEGAIYVELMASPDHAAAVGLPLADMIDGVAAGIADAAASTGITARIILVAVRHFGAERAEAVAAAAARSPHPLVTGFGMAGDEGFGRACDFARAFAIARHEAGLRCTVHAGETQGAESVRSMLAHLPVERIGHGVRASEDARLMAELADRGVVLEVCPSSNVATGVYPRLAAHPVAVLRDAGIRVTLNSDDPPFFGTSIGTEYERVADMFGLTRADLIDITRTAISAAFVDGPTQNRLLDRLIGAV